MQSKTLHGVTIVYNSKEAKDFHQSLQYPIAWEAMYMNDEVGKEFTANLSKAINNLPENQAVLMSMEGNPSDVARCVECAFANKDVFKKVLNQSLDGITFFDEQENKLIPKQSMIQDATKITQQEMAIVI